MNIKKIFKFASKGAKQAKKAKDGSKTISPWPSGTRIGIFGHENSGKTVYLTVLNEECKISKDLQITVSDKATSSEFWYNKRTLWGVASSGGDRTMVDTFEKKKFPDLTVKDRLLQFTATLDGKKKVPVVTYDYGGKAVSISEDSEQAEKVKDFMSGADGLLFFFDPKILGAEMEIQARTSAFVGILEKIAPLRSRLPIPVGLVVTKADILPGYSGEDRAVLIRPEDEQFCAENFELFLEKILASGPVAGEGAWAGTVRNILVKLRDFIRVVVGRTLDFQIFFVSNVGNKPVKIGADIGRSIYEPPDNINPCGVKEPFYWILKSAVRNKRLNLLRKITKFTAAAALIWIVLYSLPFLLHFNILLSKTYRVEDHIRSSYKVHELDNEKAKPVKDAYYSYRRKWLVRKMFSEYQVPAASMESIYGEITAKDLGERMDDIILNLAQILENKDIWPKHNPENDSLVYHGDTQKFITGLREMDLGGEESALSRRSERVRNYWGMFAQFVRNDEAPELAATIRKQVDFNKDLSEYNPAEKKLGEALLSIVADKTVEKEEVIASETGLEEYNQIKEKIAASSDPLYLLDTAVKDLTKIMAKLKPGTHAKEREYISTYINAAKVWEKHQDLTCIISMPADDHLHFEVTRSGAKPAWDQKTQFWNEDEIPFKWRIGDDIYIAYDRPHDSASHPEKWGAAPSELRVFNRKMALFDVEGEIAFQNIDKRITIRFKKGGLKERLPKLK